ncbi:efflux RND transporter permease subunit [Novosphingobium sp. JCM 18896]|uniref:efflux RND transporter permease subunit n=1 Tax=Novosphingobium sp. JCM 18896 TaxID=2989731 RepID=UPI0022220F30|nr:efflux RND transporter permease subunit [Novosphingobium sp. JCM 18896]MCW1429882.1 efflux RND transporter permease subunit [Novosphingobium sp. JCM 18896]
MSRIFIDRPIFAWVIAIITMLLGLITLRSLPVEQYPDIAPPQVNIRANYPGASAETLENSVTQVIEQQLTGIDGLLYFSSQSSSRGRASISATFEKGTDPDIAQVQVQNRVQQALSRLPQQVQQQGVTVTKSNPDFLMVMGIYDTTDKSSNLDVADFMVSNLQDSLGRIEGVGETDVFGSQYAMRIWLDPAKLAGFSLVPGDVVSAVQAQNTEVAAGEIGAVPSPQGQMLNATVTAQSRLSKPEEFAKIVLKTLPSGAIVQLKDVARIELGAENYGVIGRINGHPAAGMAISLSPGADALLTAERVKAMIAESSKSFPAGYKVAYPNDSTIFIEKSVEDVVVTLGEAIVLVVIVMFIFLQSWRATLIPAIAVPVVLLGTIAVFGVADFSINTLTLFGMVLAIGLLVDDAIVVVENVERLMAENPGMTPREATIQSMQEIQVALVAIALVLSAVFLPMAFFGGSTGVIYKQFSLTIVSAMVLSVLVALILSPALTATLLKRHEDEDHEGFVGRNSMRMRVWFDRHFSRLVEWHQARTVHVIDRKRRYLVLYGLVVVLLAVLFLRLPTGFVPNEDQGVAALQYQLPPGATLERTNEAARQIEDYFQKNEAKNIYSLQTVAGGGGGGGGGQSSGRGFLGLKNWDERPGKENSAEAITRRATRALSSLRDVEFYAVVPPSVRGLGQSTGFTAELLNSSGMSREAFRRVQEDIVAEARGNSALANVRLSSLPDQPTLKVDADPQKLSVLGLSQADVNATMSTAWGGRYVNDFNDRGRVKRVFVQGDAPYRSHPEDLGLWQVRGSSGQMVPISAIAAIGWSNAPINLSRFNGVSNYELNGQAAPGTSSGEAMNAIAAIVAKYQGVSIAWAGASYEERLSSGQAPFLYVLSLLVVFLCLAALYESWSIPVAVLLIIPLGLIGAVFAVTLRGLENDIYLQIGLLTTMGLAAKNAILMIEFAEQAERKGARIIDAALEAAKTRLRPILMTSCAFIFGVLPLAIANGAGANSRIAIGTAVIGGMLTATLLAVFYIPLFFVLVRRGVRDGMKKFHDHYHPLTGPTPEEEPLV